MNTGQKNRTRSERVAALQLAPGNLDKILGVLREPEVWLRISICLVASVVIWAITGAWKPQFPYRTDQVPARDIVARVAFKTPDAQATKEKRDSSIRNAKAIYENDPQALIDLRSTLAQKVREVLDAKELDARTSSIWRTFSGEATQAETENKKVESSVVEISRLARQLAAVGTGQSYLTAEPPNFDILIPRIEFGEFRSALASDSSLNGFHASVAQAFSPFERQGFLEKLQHSDDVGSLSEIRVYQHPNEPTDLTVVDVRDVRIADAAGLLQERLRSEFKSNVVADRVFAWLKPRIPTTLKFQETITRNIAEDEALKIPEVMVNYNVGESLAKGGVPLEGPELELLRAEHQADIQAMNFGDGLRHSLAKFGMYGGLLTLCGFYSFYRRRRLIGDISGLARLLSLIVITIGLCCIPGGRWPAEIIPLLILSMTIAIAYDQEIALLVSAAVCVVVTFSLGMGMPQLVSFLSAMATTALSLSRLRSRTKLLYVGVIAALVGMFTNLGAETILGETWSWTLMGRVGRFGFCVVLAGLLMTGLLPFIERMFRIQTDLSLLELGDVSHPLLQELVRRAPGTYNHSINVASIAEAAAEEIGANGLLVRVGAYFHDIGKMMKPGYFIENQNRDDNRHEQLLPAMSTLIIIAHVKDGADMARQHNLPKPLIDFILQHHGTTLVEYFYRQASKQSEEDPDVGEVDEGSYRYPGPKPQTKEAAVLMLADSVESAGRTLVDPAPSRIESLVHDIAMKKLLDGQFDECRLTLRELRKIEDSLIKSLTGVYHGRVKYPDQQSA